MNLPILLAMGSMIAARAGDYADSMRVCLGENAGRVASACAGVCGSTESGDCESCTIAQQKLVTSKCVKDQSYSGYDIKSDPKDLPNPPTPSPRLLPSDPVSVTPPVRSTPRSAQPASTPSTPATAAVKASAQKTQPQLPDSAQSDADADLAMCTQAFSRAQGCCNGPVNCLSSDNRAQYDALVMQMNQNSATGGSSNSSAGGVSQACAQMQAATDANRQANNLLSATCAENQASCGSSCASLVSKYQSLYANCNGCDSQSIYSSTYSSLNQKKQQCATLTAQVNTMAGQGALANNTANSSANCQAQAGDGSGMSPASMGGNSGSGTGSLSSNSTNQAGSASTEATARPENGSAGLLGQNKANGKFDLSDNADAQGMGAASRQIASKAGTSPTAGTIPNGGGGGAAGGTGAGSGARAAGGVAGRGGGNGAAGYGTDIDRGYRSGGGGTGFAGVGYNGESMSPEEIAKLSPKARETFELAQYLPGGARDPASIRHGYYSENERRDLGIHGPETNLFERIHERFVVECKLGNISDCGEYIVPPH